MSTRLVVTKYRVARAKRAGAIPGARHLEWSDLLDKRTGKFKPAPELEKLFADAGIDPKKPATTYCQSGGRASVMAFGLELISSALCPQGVALC